MQTLLSFFCTCIYAHTHICRHAHIPRFTPQAQTHTHTHAGSTHHTPPAQHTPDTPTHTHTRYSGGSPSRKHTHALVNRVSSIHQIMQCDKTQKKTHTHTHT